MFCALYRALTSHIALQAECVQHGLRTIAFCRTRKLCELVITYTREMLRASAPHLAHAISVYRAGYSPTVSPSTTLHLSESIRELRLLGSGL